MTHQCRGNHKIINLLTLAYNQTSKRINNKSHNGIFLIHPLNKSVFFNDCSDCESQINSGKLTISQNIFTKNKSPWIKMRIQESYAKNNSKMLKKVTKPICKQMIKNPVCDKIYDHIYRNIECKSYVSSDQANFEFFLNYSTISKCPYRSNEWFFVVFFSQCVKLPVIFFDVYSAKERTNGFAIHWAHCSV